MALNLILFTLSTVLQINVGSPLYKIDISATEMPTNSESTAEKVKPVPVAAVSAPKVLPVMVPVPIMGESITQVKPERLILRFFLFNFYLRVMIVAARMSALPLL